jgi:hypothetical protein
MKKPETVDLKAALNEQLEAARAKLGKIAAKLETTRTLAADLMRIRELRVSIDDCKRKLKDA